ncbi:MAG: cysteine dioxygenase [Flavobacteriales bacterium]
MSKLNKLVEFLKQEKDVKPVDIKTFLKDLKLEVSDLMPWADFDHPKHEGYGRKLVHQESNFEVMVMSWQPNDFSGVHNHGYTQWGAVQVFGNASHYIYKLDKNNDITLARKESFEYGDVAMVNNALIHQMGNQTVNPYLSLHIYGTIDPCEEITGDSKIYEIEKGRIVATTGGAFFQLDENEVTHVSELTCKEEATINEFAATLLPKSTHFSDAKKESIVEWSKKNLFQATASV